MSKIRILFFVQLIISGLYAQPLIRVYESGRYKADQPNLNLIPDHGISEINGTLLLKLDRDGIRESMQKYAGVQAADIRLVSKYKRLLEQKARLLDLLKEGLQSANGAPDYKKLNELSGFMDEFYTSLLSDPELIALADQANKEYRKNVQARVINPATYTDDMFFVDFFAKTAKAAIDRIDQSELVRFKLAGKLRSSAGTARPVHLGDDFDDIPEENYVVPRWVFSLSEDQKTELREVARLSTRLDSMRIRNFNDAKKAFVGMFASRHCVESLQAELDSLPNTFNGFGDTLTRKALALIKPLQDQVNLVKAQYLSTAEQVNIANSSEQLTGFNQQLEQFNATFGGFVSNLPKTLNAIPAAMLATPQAQHLLFAYNQCKDQITGDLNRFRTLYIALQSAFSGAQAEADFKNTITDKVKRLEWGNLPSESFIELNKTGQRKNGDVLVLQASVQMENGNNKPASIFRQEIVLQQIATYSEVKVNIILAHPSKAVPNLDKKFVFAPSYSVLFRHGSRKSQFYNDIVNVGVGLNFSSPDFDLNGVPEFGVALAVSAFKDFLSAGYGYNFGTDRPFIFVGFRVPFASAALPILNNIEQN